ncbi:MAG TPA: A/G-specific adenine glycosylase [Patescibacteria group bacterium]|nr:A/G-specific adenine glycosylase [Patescibacteria group bacterium]
MNTALIKKFRERIYTYFAHNRRVLPWRDTQDPYRIFVSEVMLQQTQVDRVLAKYRAFIAAFPDIYSLAKATFAHVFSLWQGLGYNRRAMYLIRSARMVVERFSGHFPAEINKLTELPGVGKNTACAIAAFAFNKPVVFIETNIRSVYLHFFFTGKKSVKDSKLLPLIEKTLDAKNPRMWYFALMDYGAMLKKNYTNPSRGSHHYAKQSAFAGSLRELRGKILKIVMEKGKIHEADLIKNLQGDQRIDKVLEDLQKEGFVKRTRKHIHIADGF